MIATRIGYLEWMPVAGNCWGDSTLLVLAHEVAVDPNESIEIRLRALAVMDKVMGTADPVTLEALVEYHWILGLEFRHSKSE